VGISIIRPLAGQRHISAIGPQWVIGDDIFSGPWYVYQAVMDVCYQVLHIGEAWEQFSFKYQNEGE